MESLADAGLAAMEQFKLLQQFEVQEAALNEPRNWPKGLFLAQFDRFELWAVNLGLFVMGHGSLDYRIRDSDSLRDAILKMVKNLIRSLDEVLDYLNGAIEQEDEDLDADADTESDMESDMDLLLDSVKDPIDRLYKMAVWIRNPATRMPSSKARNFQQMDQETKVDLFKAFEPFDYDYISSLFLQYEKDRALQETPTVKGEEEVGDLDNQDEVWEPVRTTLKLSKLKIATGTESYLVRRIAQANVRRRQQFAYWRSHKDKLRAHSSVVVDAPTHELPSGGHQMEAGNQNASIKAPLTVTTATQLRPLMGEAKEVFEKANVLDHAVSEYAPSAWEPSKDIVSFPLPPRVAAREQFFECPYCFTICPISILSEKAWRAHLIRDLRPYICTFENCSSSDQLYDSRDDWIQHEVSAHQTMFRCPVHPDDTFNSSEAYERHIQNHCHGEALSLSLAKSTTTNIHRSCPVCSIVVQTTHKLQSHVALHLERFAMFTLPRSEDDPDGGEPQNQSTGAHLDSDRSLDGYSETGSVVSFTAEDSDTVTKRLLGNLAAKREELLEKTRIISQTLDDIFTRPEIILKHVPRADLALVQSHFQTLHGDVVGLFSMGDALGRSSYMKLFINSLTTFVVEYGEICIKAGLLEEAIETFERLKSVQASQLSRSDPALLRTQQQLELVYEVKNALQEVNEALGPEADLHTEPGKSMAMKNLARTALGMHHAETIWGPSIRKEMARFMADHGTAAHETILEETKPGAASMEYNSGGSKEWTGSEPEILGSEKLIGTGEVSASPKEMARTPTPDAVLALDQQRRNSLVEQDQRPMPPEGSNEDEERPATATPIRGFEQLHTNDGGTASDIMLSGAVAAEYEIVHEGGVSWKPNRDEYSQPNVSFDFGEFSDRLTAEGGRDLFTPTDDPERQEMQAGQQIQEDPEMEEERRQVEREMEVFRHIIHPLWVAAQLEKRSEAKARDIQAMKGQWIAHQLVMDLRSYRCGVEELKSQFLTEARKMERSKKAHVLTTEIRSFNWKAVEERLEEIRLNRRARLEATQEGEEEARNAQTAQEHDKDDTQMADPEDDLTREPRQIRIVDERKRALSTSPPRRLQLVARLRQEAHDGGRPRDMWSQRPDNWRCCKCAAGWMSFQRHYDCPSCHVWRCPNCEYSTS